MFKSCSNKQEHLTLFRKHNNNVGFESCSYWQKFGSVNSFSLYFLSSLRTYIKEDRTYIKHWRECPVKISNPSYFVLHLGFASFQFQLSLRVGNSNETIFPV